MNKSLSHQPTDPALLKYLSLSNKRVKSKLDDVYSDIGIKPSSYEVLVALLTASPANALTPNELMKLTHITSGTMTTRIDKLSKKGWVKRVVNTKDKRSVKVALTSTGKAVIEAAVKQHDDGVKRILSVWTAKEQQQLTKLLAKITD